MDSRSFTHRSGFAFEDVLASLLSKYTRNIWRNVSVETLLTEKGFTEIDLLFCYNEIVFIVEAKNISRIDGDYGDPVWRLYGSKTNTLSEDSYTALNVITQNNIHVRAFKDYFCSVYHEWPAVFPMIIVPTGCKFSPTLADAVMPIGKLDPFMVRNFSDLTEPRIHRKVASLIPRNGCELCRPDFVLDSTGGRRVKGRGC